MRHSNEYSSSLAQAADDNDSVEYVHTNRQKSKRAKPGLFWCFRCDRSIVGDSQRCRICRWRKEPRRWKEAA